MESRVVFSFLMGVPLLRFSMIVAVSSRTRNDTVQPYTYGVILGHLPFFYKC